MESYSEISPSGKGIKIFIKGELKGSGRNFGNIEMYDTGRYFTVTGNRLDEFPDKINYRELTVQNLYFELDQKAKRLDLVSIEITGDTKNLITEGVPVGDRSEAIMTVLNALVGAGMHDSRIFEFFDHYPIGDKYREKGNSKHGWLQKQIDKAKEYVGGNSGTGLEFPYDVMAGAAGKFAEIYGSHLETPKEFLFMSYLTCLGNVLANKLTLESEISPQPRLYTLLLGQSADERKSTAIEKTVDHFKEAVHPFNVTWGVNSAEGLQKILEHTQDGLLLGLDEFKLFVSKCKIDSSVLLQCVNTLYESNRYESRTKSSHVQLEDAHLSILAASTVDTYEATWSTSFTDIGFNNRLLLVPGKAERKFSIPQKVSGDNRNILIGLLRGIIDHVGKFKELRISDEAKDIYHKWYMSLEGSVHSKRLDTYAMRLMALLAANELKAIVDVDIVHKAIRLCNWQLDVRQLYDPIDADNFIATMEQKIRKHLRVEPLKDYILKRKVNANRAGLWIYETAINNLTKAKEIIMKKKKTWYLLEPVL